MNRSIAVVNWIHWGDVDKSADDIGGLGGFFNNGMRWTDYLKEMPDTYAPHFEALREAIVERGLREGGDWHQNHPEGVPIFSDGSVATFSYRAWGDLLAATWSEHDGADYNYMSFYMSSLVNREPER